MRLRSRNVEKDDESIPPKPNRKVVNTQADFDKEYINLVQPGSFTNKIIKYLRANQTASLHRPRRKKFPRRRIVTRYPGNILQSDLIDMQKFSTKNSNYSFILVVIDCFTKKVWARPLKNKRGDSTAAALRSIFESMEYPIQSLIFDEGLEYLNKYVETLLEEYNIHSYHIKTKLKASSAERFNRTLKEKIWKYFTSTGRNRWIDALEDLIESYNNTYHKSIKMTPNQVNMENRKQVFKNLFPKYGFKFECRLHRGDKVRVALFKPEFSKGFTQNWSRDIFTVTKSFQSNGVCWYRIKDRDGAIYPKYKYFYELNKV